MKVNEKMTFREILEKNENAADVLVKHGLHCSGCHMARMETLEEGATAHGLGKDDIKKIVEELNE